MLKKAALAFWQRPMLRYLSVASTATLIDATIYTWLFYHVFEKKIVHVGKFAIGPHLFSISISFTIGLLTNFWLSKKVVFKGSQLNTRTQFSRFLIIASIVFVSNWFLTNFLVLKLTQLVATSSTWLAFVARGASALIIASISFFSHKFFSFESHKPSTTSTIS